jgi:signal transduction histidine kinase
MDKHISKCSLCGKNIKGQQEQKSPSVLKEVIGGTSYVFDRNECVTMFKRFRSLYGNDFKKLLAPQEQFVSDPFWNIAIPTEQEIREIEIEKGTVPYKPDTIQVLQDPVQIQTIGHEIAKVAKNEILIMYSSANAFHRQEKLGAIQSLREIIERKSGVKARILTPKGELIEETVRNLREQNIKIDIRYIEPGLQTYVTIVVVDRESSLIVELKDDTKKSSYEAMGLGTFSNRKATVLSYVSIFESLWKQSELYEKLSELYEQLKIRDKLQTEFVNIAAHELRTPIQPIIGLAEVLRSKRNESTSTDTYDEYLSIIIRNARRLKELTDNILYIARIESKSITLNRKLVNLDNVIKDAVEDAVENQADPKLTKIQFDSSIRSGDNIILVNIDKDRIKQVVSNLLRNALKFTSEGVVSITVSRQKGQKGEQKEMEDGEKEVVVVSIQDTGSGIDPEIFSRLFTKFSNKYFSGTGLGLYISKNIIEAHDGKIWATNNIGQGRSGATFYFSLPMSHLNRRCQ